MRVQFFNPPVNHYDGVWYRMNPGLGLPILAAVLKARGHEVGVVDAEALRSNPEAIGRAFSRSPQGVPDAVGLTVTSHNARGARETVAAIHAAGYGGYIMLGGPHVTMLAHEGRVPQGLWGADAWVVGECEGNIGDIVEHRRMGVIAGVPMGIEFVPGPEWGCHVPSPMEYGGNLPDVGKPEGIAMWSRGCPGVCTFCGNPVFGRSRIRRRPVWRVEQDMAALKALGARAVFVYDDELVGAPDAQGAVWLEACCERVAPLGLKWKCQGRCSQRLSVGTLEMMKAAGCEAIMWGVESFHDGVLGAMRKGTTESDIWHTLRIARAAGIANWLFLMVGNADEGPAELAHTEARLAEAVREGLVQYRQVTVCTPVPGTPLYERAKAEGWLVEPPEAGPQMNQVYASTPWLKARQIREWKHRLEVAGA